MVVFGLKPLTATLKVSEALLLKFRDIVSNRIPVNPGFPIVPVHVTL
jgi:hypothetical protein